MARSLQSKLNQLSDDRKKKVMEKASELIESEMTLRDLRLALDKTQTAVGEELNMNQEGVSRLERRSDMLLSTLRKYVRSMGGEIKITAEFPGKPSVSLQGFSDLKSQNKPPGA
jgi:hypothetical protein